MYFTALPSDVVFAAISDRPIRTLHTDLPDRLRQAIQENHDKIEQLPVSKAILKSSISQAIYGQLLSQLWYVHRELEREIESNSPIYSILLLNRVPPRSPTISRDLDQLELECSPILPSTVHTIKELQKASRRCFWSLLGAIYVLEGSRMGSMVLVKPLSKALGVPLLPNAGLDYHLEGIEQRPHTWKQFKTFLTTLPLTDEEVDIVVASAADFMSNLYSIFAALTELFEDDFLA